MTHNDLYKIAHESFLYFNGVLFYKRNGVPYKMASSVHSRGYITATLNGKTWYAHRIIYFMHTGKIPSQIDHINRIKDDNRIENLRIVTPRQNSANTKIYSNNKSGFKGVCWHSQTKKWRAYKTVNGKQKSLGLFNKKEDAFVVSRKAREDIYGEFINL